MGNIHIHCAQVEDEIADETEEMMMVGSNKTC
jgi:hypothetical protein